MKTRSNMPLFVVETDNVKALSNSQIDLLRCGDYLVKKDASGEHAYKVTFKSDTGMCITYMDAYCVETQSYDKVDGNWVYNSEDKTIIAEPQMENIVDAQGRNRFIEDDIELHSDMPSGVSLTYGKWALSGTHLLIVVALELSNGVTISNGNKIAELSLPKWVVDKIYPLWASLYVETKSFSAFANDWSTQSFGVTLSKLSSEKITIQKNSSLTLTTDRSVRIAFDLLIDND